MPHGRSVSCLQGLHGETERIEQFACEAERIWPCLIKTCQNDRQEGSIGTPPHRTHAGDVIVPKAQFTSQTYPTSGNG